MNKTLRIWTGLVGAPVAWLFQVGLSEMFASYACYPHRVPLTAPLWNGLPFGVLGLNVACLAISFVACRITWSAWRRTKHELQGHEEHAIEVGESREAFLVMLGALSNAVFVVAILFTACAIFLVTPCSPWSR